MGQTISQPFIVGYMTQLLNLSPGARVLEIGTGSGYQAAVLAEITPEVYTVKIIRELGEKARSRFEKLGYSTIRTKTGDGYYGWEKYAPFDAIIVTAAAGHLPPPLVTQIKPGGRIVIPIGSPYHTQTLMNVIKTRDGKIQTERKLPVRFVPMTGAALE
jgi:protein-L-isoaspartate(D-aspartate) O-methyltransferase